MELSPIQQQYKDVFGDLNCPICGEPIDWDLHEEDRILDHGICVSEECDGNIVILTEEDIEELKEYADQRKDSDTEKPDNNNDD